MVSQASYDQRTGAFTIYGAVDDKQECERILYVCKGYAGKGACKNNPDCEYKRNEGPLPVGRYRLVPINHHRFRDPVFWLQQLEGPTYGRSGFLIHGDASGSKAGQASRGCIVLGWHHRVAIREFEVTSLEVFASLAPTGRVLDSSEATTGTND